MTRAADVARSFAHLHADAARVLGDWPAPDAAQEALRRGYLAHLASHPDAVAKAGPPEHLTASCLVLDAAGDRVLLTHHRRARQWFQFGGHLEAEDASLWAAARREAVRSRASPGSSRSPTRCSSTGTSSTATSGTAASTSTSASPRSPRRAPSPGQRRVARRPLVAGRRPARRTRPSSHPSSPSPAGALGPR